jgi:hypothetical protein
MVTLVAVLHNTHKRRTTVEDFANLIFPTTYDDRQLTFHLSFANDRQDARVDLVI